MLYRNCEGYADPTAGAAMARVMREFRRRQKKRHADKNRRKVYGMARKIEEAKRLKKTIRYFKEEDK